MKRTTMILAALSVAVSVGSLGCANKKAAKVPDVSQTTPTSGEVNVDAELLRLCHIEIGNTERAPKFDFDEAALLPQDREVLEKIAACFTSGPLKGKKLSLIGRADPRGETEYNMLLGGHRAETVKTYLTHLGMPDDRMTGTTRGELDAEGTDEAGWKMDRRVDLLLGR